MSRLTITTLVGLLAFLSIPSCKRKQIQKVAAPAVIAPLQPNATKIELSPLDTQAYQYQPAPIKKQVPLYWDWDQIDTSAINFPDNFLWGVGTSAHQVEGNCTNNDWHLWEQAGNTEHLTGTACNHWNTYKEDIQLMKSLGINTYRFSVEWSKIEPRKNTFDASALDHYEDVCKELINAGIKPVITLHHYTSPEWFAHMGGFEKEENIGHFVTFAQKVFERLHSYVHLWLTFNSPTSYAARGYYKHLAYPGVKDTQLMQEVIKNILEAHVQTYQALKQLPGGPDSRIGILHNIYQVEQGSGWLDGMGCRSARSLFDDNVYGFFTTGEFKVNVSFTAKLKHINKDAPKSLDFIGLNYYSHGLMKSLDVQACKDDLPTNCDLYTIYPEGLYRAIVDISQNIAKPLQIPIYITENGISTDHEEHRELFFKRYLFALSQALAEGHNVGGYIVWSLMDNYEWGTYNKKYGICDVDFTTQKRTLKPGAQCYIDTIKKFTHVEIV